MSVITIAGADVDLDGSLVERLRVYGHEIRHHPTLQGAAGALGKTCPELVLVLPFRDSASGGERLIERVRGDTGNPAGSAQVPIIAVTRHDDLWQRLALFEAGADDALSMPFEPLELRARIRALIHRPGRRRSPTRRVGALAIDFATRDVTVDGNRVALRAREYELLRVLISEPTRVFTKDELLKTVWNLNGAGWQRQTRTLDSHASRLRASLNRAGATNLVRNIWGVGYRLIDTVPEPVELAA